MTGKESRGCHYLSGLCNQRRIKATQKEKEGKQSIHSFLFLPFFIASPFRAMDGDHRGAERSNRISRDEEIHLILRTLAHAMKVLKEQKEWRKEILQRLDTLDQNFRALLATPEKEARRILVEHDRVRSPIFIIQKFSPVQFSFNRLPRIRSPALS